MDMVGENKAGKSERKGKYKVRNGNILRVEKQKLMSSLSTFLNVSEIETEVITYETIADAEPLSVINGAIKSSWQQKLRHL